jgi:hypothetical protein
MTEEQLRALVREAIGRHVGSGSAAASSHLTGPAPASPARPSGLTHPSHALFFLPAANDSGACVIEPAVTCNHCGYCKAMGH